MFPKTPLAEWQHILIDTSVLVDYFSDATRYEKNPLVKRRIELSQKVLNALAEIELPEGKKRCIYISSITIGELRKLPQSDNVNLLVETLIEHDVIFVDYTKRIATDLLYNLEKYLPLGQKFQFVAHLEKVLKIDGVASARQWIEDDMKIVACAKSIKKLDVVLTSDARTFLPIAEAMEVPCITMNEDNFQKDIFGNLDFTGISQTKRKKR
ncbi:MAG: hypothetical protein JNL70_00935 [Saprospiraceae bacterium]|nr:hypothetical protein [Saprospiraceae bacterium]